MEKQIAEDPLNVDNAWLEDKYGYNVKGFIKDDNVNADKNKKKLVETLSYLYNHYIEPVADAASELVFIAKKWYNRRYEKRISSNKLRK